MASSNAKVIASGAHIVRFHTGHKPIIMLVSVCKKNQTLCTVAVRFSELVNPSSEPSSIKVLTKGKETSCTKTTPPTSAGVRSITLSCGMSGDAPTTVEISPGHLSVSGAPMLTFGGKASATLNFPALPQGCVTRKVE
jgi:hypothetical protein